MQNALFNVRRGLQQPSLPRPLGAHRGVHNRDERVFANGGRPGAPSAGTSAGSAVRLPGTPTTAVNASVPSASSPALAEKFVELYWRQARPFRVGDEQPGSVLQQNTGPQAAIVDSITTAQKLSSAWLFRFQRSEPTRWVKLLAQVERTVCGMPLWKLQTVGAESLEFLSANLGRGNTITLKPGVAYCLRAFYELIRDLIEGA